MICSVTHTSCSIFIQEQFSSLPIEKANAYRRRVGTKKLIREILKLLQLRKSDVHEGLKLEFPKYEKHIHNFLGFIERTKARDAKMNIGYQLKNCDEQSQVINLTGNASPITDGKRLVKAIAWKNLEILTSIPLKNHNIMLRYIG
jgi:hypothetical protein